MDPSSTTALITIVPSVLTVVVGFYASVGASKTTKHETEVREGSACEERLNLERERSSELADKLYDIRMERVRDEPA